MAERDVILLVVEEAVEDDARSRRDRDHEAFMPVPDVPDADIVDSLRTAMGWPGELDDLQVARYHRVCIVAFPSSPVRTWVTAFFAAEAPWLIETGGLWWCLPPFDRRHVRPMMVADALSLADQWERLQPEPRAPARLGPKLHPWSDRSGSGGWWSGPQVVVAAGDPMYHLRVREGRRSFCGRPAKGLDDPEPAVHLEEIPKDRRCPGCARLWWEEIRPQREWEKRDVLRRREATEACWRPSTSSPPSTGRSPTRLTGLRRTLPSPPSPSGTPISRRSTSSPSLRDGGPPKDAPTSRQNRRTFAPGSPSSMHSSLSGPNTSRRGRNLRLSSAEGADRERLRAGT